MENLKEKTTQETYSYVKEKIEIDKKDAELINTILNFAIENKMAFSEIEHCIEEIKRIYLENGLINRYQK